MDSPIVSPCPNCGEQVSAQPDSANLFCPACGEELAVSSGNKIVLAHPLAAYLHLGLEEEARDSTPEEQWEAERLASRIEYRRRQAWVELVFQRIQAQKEAAARAYRVSLVMMSLGIVVVLLTVGWFLTSRSALSNLILPGIVALGLVPLGVYFFVWSTLLSQSLVREERQVQEELEDLRAQADAYAD
jgi:ribosomal protein S27E